MRKWISLLMLACCATRGLALQIKNAVDNETVIAKVSSLDVTRIFVEGDRIQSLQGVRGAYTRENDEQNGEIYIQPTPAYQNRAFTLLMTTENGRHFTLLLNPTASPSETIMLVPKGVNTRKALQTEQALPYHLTIGHLIKAMRNHTLPKGYISQEIDGPAQYKINNQLSYRIKTHYEGVNFSGEIIEIQNVLSHPLKLNESVFYQLGTCALSFDQRILPPHGVGYLYRVFRHAN